jgi:sporulation protein YlmC with PRC-barrel domain
MAFSPYHYIQSANTGLDNELIAIGENSGNIKMLAVTPLTSNTSGGVSVNFYLKDSEDNKYYITYRLVVPLGSTLVIDEEKLLAFNNGTTGYSLNVSTAHVSDIFTVFIKK